jgi:arylsulfatase A-like enzyme
MINKSILGLMFTSLCVGSAVAQKDKPNIVFIMADDLGYSSLGCYGNTGIRTPNIDRLAQDGLRFTDYHSHVFCTPTRASLMTGRYAERAAWVDDAQLSPVFQEQRKANIKQRWAWGISLDEVTIARVLKQAGYRTGLIGKWHLGYDFKFHPMNFGFDEFRGYLGGNVDYHTHKALFGLKELDWWNGKTIKNEDGYSTDLLSGYSVDFIEKHQKEPFFLYVAQEAPHEPWQGRGVNSAKSPVENYREQIEVLDESVGRIRKALQDNHLEQKTLLIFCSDNGPAYPRGFTDLGKLQGGKGKVQEGGHRVPFLACYPGKIPAGTVCNETAVVMDMFPTFAALAGAKMPKSLLIDGVDISDLLFKQDKIEQRTLHWEMDGQWAVRKGVWKLIGSGEKGLELFNLQEDIREVRNEIKEYPVLAESLEKEHLKWVREVNIGMPLGFRTKKSM